MYIGSIRKKKNAQCYRSGSLVQIPYSSFFCRADRPDLVQTIYSPPISEASACKFKNHHTETFLFKSWISFSNLRT